MTEYNKPEVIRTSLLTMQVCVPSDWSYEEVKTFADSANPAGTLNGWSVMKEGCDGLYGFPEKVQCDKRDNCVHMMLEV